MTVIYRMVLECTEGTSNKYYDMRIVKDQQGILGVLCIYGPIGKPGKTVDKGKGMNLRRAQAMINDLMNKKLAKGYQVTYRFDQIAAHVDKTPSPSPQPPSEDRQKLQALMSDMCVGW